MKWAKGNRPKNDGEHLITLWSGRADENPITKTAIYTSAGHWVDQEFNPINPHHITAHCHIYTIRPFGA